MLTSYSDMKHSYSYSPHLSNRLLKFYRLGGMTMFYAVSFILRPARLLKAIVHFVGGRQESRLDVALHSIRERIFSKKVRLQDVWVDRTTRLAFLATMSMPHNNLSHLLRKPAWLMLLPLCLQFFKSWRRGSRSRWLRNMDDALIAPPAPRSR
jgi:hypothetical protein